MPIGVIVGITLIVFAFIVLILPILPNLIRKIVLAVNEFPKEPKRNSNELSRWYFLTGAKRANHNYRVVSGNLHPGVYNQGTVTSLAKILADKPKLKVRVFVGPSVLCTAKSGDNPLWKMHKTRNFEKQLQIRVLTGYPEEHYRVVDDRELYWEDPHDSLSTDRKFHVNWMSCTNATAFAYEFDKAWEKADPKRLPRFESVSALSK